MGDDSEGLSQRQTVRALMPEIYLMRRKDYSYAQITTLMVACGIKLQPSTLRSYFNEFFVEYESECIRRFDEQILLQEEVKKKTRGADMSQISARVAAIRARQNKQVSSIIDAVFGIGGGDSGQVVSGAGAEAMERPVEIQKKTAHTGDNAVPAAATPPGVMGLLDRVEGVAAGGVGDVSAGRAKKEKVVFDSGSDPVVPDLSKPAVVDNAAAAADPPSSDVRGVELRVSP